MSTVPEMITSKTTGLALSKLAAYVVSDVHLTTSLAGVAHRDNFLRFLQDLNQNDHDGQKRILILNGDIFDITGSWQEPCLPWDEDSELAEQALLSVLRQILDQNREIVAELQQFIDSGHRIVYLFGNHDRLIAQSQEAQALLRQTLSADEGLAENLQFDTRFEHTELGLYVEHGQRFDPFNRGLNTSSPPIGDAINILIVNRFVSLVLQKMTEAGYGPEVCLEMRQILHQLEYLRPISLGPFWLKSMARHYRNYSESEGKPMTLEQIIDQVIRETLLNPVLINLIARQFHMPSLVMKAALIALLDFPSLLPVVSFAVSRLLNKTDSNDFQYHMAQRIQRERGFHLISFGHTHTPSLIPITEEDYYFNTGCWKPVIYLFRHAEDFFFPNRPFNRVNRSGVFKVERDLSEPDAPIRFSLLTLQDGVTS